MKIVICGSSKFRAEKVTLRDELEKLGFETYIDSWTETVSSGTAPEFLEEFAAEPAEVKKKYDFIKEYYNAIVESEAILVANYDKDSIKGYVGANTFLEVGFAHALGKEIFLLNDLPDQPYINDELISMEPTVLRGDLTLIGGK